MSSNCWFDVHRKLKVRKKESNNICHLMWRPIWKGTYYFYFERGIFQQKELIKKFRISGPNSNDVISINCFGFHFWIQYNFISFREAEHI